MKAAGIIPARYESSRFPGKMLTSICGKPMIHHVVSQVQKATMLDEVQVATDDERIADIIQSLGIKAVMTDPELASGTDRIAVAAEQINTDIVVNIQGDEPLINPEDIDQVVNLLIQNEDAVMSTLAKRIVDAELLHDPNVVKVIFNKNKEALYFSRYPIPYIRNTEDQSKWPELHPFYQHIGLYGYRKSFLLQAAAWPKSPLESAESLEQLRVLENGFKILVGETENTPIGVDMPADVQKVESILCHEHEH